MIRKEKNDMQNKYIDVMVKNMPVLRTSIRMTQAQLSEKVGVSRQTIVAIETKKRTMPWTLYLAIVHIFQQYEDSKVLMENFNLYNAEFIKEIF